MDFIAENYLWIILIVIVILMAIVGYVAEKTEFIKKAENPIKPKKIKEDVKPKEEPIVIEDKGIDELLKDNVNNSFNEPEVNTEDMIQPQVDDNIMQPLVSEPIENNETIDESLFAPLEPINNEPTDFTQVNVTPLQDIEVNTETPVANEEDIWKF